MGVSVLSSVALLPPLSAAMGSAVATERCPEPREEGPDAQRLPSATFHRRSVPPPGFGWDTVRRAFPQPAPCEVHLLRLIWIPCELDAVRLENVENFQRRGYFALSEN